MLFIRNVRVDSPVILSPMAGFSDSPYRLLTRQMGSGISFTEFVSANDILKKPERVKIHFQFESKERPICFQIFGNHHEIILEAAKRICGKWHPDLLDVNMGCSTAKVTYKGSGAGLLKKPAYAGKIIEILRKNIQIPITAKIRLGWDEDSLNYLEVTRILEESGVEAISVHGRTKMMGYQGRANWQAIAEIKELRKIPIFGNGDIESYQHAIDMLKKYKVDAVLIGRHAIGNPWIFSGQKKQELAIKELKDFIRKHLDLMIQFYGSRGLILFRKHLVKYLKHYSYSDSLKRNILTTIDYSEFCNLLQQAPLSLKS